MKMNGSGLVFDIYWWEEPYTEKMEQNKTLKQQWCSVVWSRHISKNRIRFGESYQSLQTRFFTLHAEWSSKEFLATFKPEQKCQNKADLRVIACFLSVNCSKESEKMC